MYNLKTIWQQKMLWMNEIWVVDVFFGGMAYITTVRAVWDEPDIMMTSSNGIISTLQAICVGNSPVTWQFPAQRPVTRRFDVFFDLRLNKRLSKQWWGWQFEMPSCSLWHHCSALYSHMEVCRVFGKSTVMLYDFPCYRLGRTIADALVPQTLVYANLSAISIKHLYVYRLQW